MQSPTENTSGQIPKLNIFYLENLYFYIVSDKASEAGKGEHCYELHARSGLKFIVRLQEDALILPKLCLNCPNCF